MDTAGFKGRAGSELSRAHDPSNIRAMPANRKRASQTELLSYIGDLLLELQTLAVKSRLEGLADIIGCAQREVERNLKEK